MSAAEAPTFTMGQLMDAAMTMGQDHPEPARPGTSSGGAIGTRQTVHVSGAPHEHLVREVTRAVPTEVRVVQEVPKEVIREVIKEVVKEVPVEVPVEVIREVPVEVIRTIIKEVPREVIKEVPMEVIKEVIVEAPCAHPLPPRTGRYRWVLS